MSDLNDTRTLDEMNFACNVPEDVRATVAGSVRDILKSCGCQNAEDVANLGCTGLIAHGIDIDKAKFVREHMAGAGLGLTCFIDLHRYCLVHETFGALQEGQMQRFPEAIDKVSRPLTVQEKTKVAIVEKARRSDKMTKAKEMLSRGKGLPDDLAKDEDTADLFADSIVQSFSETPPAVASTPSAAASTPALPSVSVSLTPVAPLADALKQLSFAIDCGADFDKILSILKSSELSNDQKNQLRSLLEFEPAKSFECPEHGATFWGCRFCVAAEIAKGDYTMKYLIAPCEEGTSSVTDNIEEIESDMIETSLNDFEENSYEAVGLFVKVARWVRKLTRD